LDKGLSFIPTTKSIPISHIYDSLNKLTRSLKLKSFFRNRSNKLYDPKLKTFEAKSTWTPSDNQIDQPTKTTIAELTLATNDFVKSQPLDNTGKFIRLNEKNNLDRKELFAIKKLASNQDIIIKPADKGSAVVVMNKTDYIQEAMRQLDNPKYYTRIDHPVFPDNATRINHILQQLFNTGFINRRQLIYLTANEDARPRVFYLLPKIHKQKDKWPNVKMPDGRPIVSDCSSESYRVSEFLDYHINPLSITHSSYIKDTYHFISKIRNTAVPHNCFLVTGDITALYTNMDITRTIEIVRRQFAAHPKPNRPDKELLELLEITLRGNDFQFNGQWFLQIMGTAMGKRYAPGLANLFLLEFDEKAQTGFRIKPQHYGRFLDDILFVWMDTLESLKEFNNYLNSLMTNIVVTLCVHSDKVDFLDTTVFKHTTEDMTTLQTKVFFKETDTHQLLHKTSFHPKHTAKGVLKSQILRFKRICSFKDDFEQACQILFKALGARSYSKSLMRKLKRDIWNNYNPPKNQDKKLARPLDINTTISTVSNPTNLTCRPGCKTCIMIPNTTHFKSTNNNKEFPRCQELNCKTKSCIYLITCLKCQLQYVGETGRTLNERMIDHRSSIKCKRQTPVGVHFNEAGHQPSDMSVIPLERVVDSIRRKEREQWYQTLLGTMHPFGINGLISGYTDFTKVITNTKQILPIVLQYSHASCKLIQNWKTIVMKNQLYKDLKLISAFSNDQNLQRRLVRSKFW
jgi:hypothetical protein